MIQVWMNGGIYLSRSGVFYLSAIGYYSYIKNYRRDEGSAFMENVYLAGAEAPEWVDGPGASDKKFDPNEKWRVGCQPYLSYFVKKIVM